MAALNAGWEANDSVARMGSSRDVHGHVSWAKRDLWTPRPEQSEPRGSLGFKNASNARATKTKR
jgi:hypothetical protein